MPEMTNKERRELARAVTGDVQPSDKLHPSFRQEDQEMAEELQPVIIGPPAYASPDPNTNNGRLVPIEDHPLSADIAESYGARQKAGGATTSLPDTLAGADAEGGPGDKPREEWSKADWQKQASAMGLATSGKKDAIKTRVEEREAEVNEAKALKAEEWIGQIEDAEDEETLDNLAALYEASGADYSTVAEAFSEKRAELSGENDDS